MKIYKRILLLGITAILLAACGTEESNSAPEDGTENVHVMFNHGVNGDYEIMGDTQNYLSFTGKLSDEVDSNQVSVIDVETNLVLGTAETNENNEFYIYSNMQGAGDREIIFTYDDSVDIPTVENINSLNSIVPMYYIENTFLESEESSSQDSASEEVNTESESDETFSVGDTAYFDSGIEVTVENIEMTDEEPNGDINGNFVRVDFIVDNQTSQTIDFNNTYIDLYDGDRNKAELNAKEYYSENIASGMKGNGSAYFDSIEEGPFSVVIGGATWTDE